MSKNVLTEQINSSFKILKDKPANVLKRIKGVVSDNKSNRNGRIYPIELWKNVVESDYVKEMIDNHSLFGEADHPETRLEISLQNVSHAINDLWIDGDKVMAIIDILPTPMGKILSELLDYGTNLGISSRGAGTVLSDNTVDPDDYQFVTFDFVARPSCEAARLNTILESAAIEAKNTKDDEINNLLESYKSGLKESDGVLDIDKIRKTLSDEDAEGLDLVLDDLYKKVDFEKDPLSTIEDLVHDSVFKYNDANALPEYKGEEFYGREYNARNIYNAILKMYGRDKQTNDLSENHKSELNEGTSNKRIDYFGSFDNGHVIHGDWKKMTPEEAEDMARQASIDDHSHVYYVHNDDVMNPVSNSSWYKGEKHSFDDGYKLSIKLDNKNLEESDNSYTFKNGDIVRIDLGRGDYSDEYRVVGYDIDDNTLYYVIKRLSDGNIQEVDEPSLISERDYENLDDEDMYESFSKIRDKYITESIEEELNRAIID